MDDPGRLLAEWRLIKKSGMPRDYGMTENNVIYRKHNNPLVKEMMYECWKMLTEYSKRDQLCFAFHGFCGNMECALMISRFQMRGMTSKIFMCLTM